MPERIGRYRIVDELGRGGMGIVYRAVDPELDRQVAVKVIAIENGGEAAMGELEARFRREARAAARVTHPAVVTIHDVGREGTALFLVMELVRGGSLADRFKRGDHPSPAEALEIAACVAEALAAAHTAGLVHRDVKPANILFSDSGQVKVTDFGVARAMDEQSELTRTGIVLGSPAYMAPEQLKSSQVDGRADLFGLGVVLYESLMRRKPFAADTITSLVYEILTKDPFEEGSVRGTLGDPLAGFLRWCLAKDPVERVPDGIVFAAEARRLVSSGAAGVAELGMATVVGSTSTSPTNIRAAVASAAPPTLTAATRHLPPPPPLPPVPSMPVTAARHEGMAVDGTGARSGALSATQVRSGRTWGIALAVVAILLLCGVVVVGYMLRPEAPAGTDAAAAARPPGVFWGSSPDGAGATSTPAWGARREEPIEEPQVVPTEPEPAPVTTTAVATGAAEAAGSVAPPVAQAPPQPAPVPPQAAPAPPSSGATLNLGPEDFDEPVPAPAPAPAPVFEPPPVSETFECERAAEFHVSPEEAEVTIGGKLIGIADDWDGAGGGQEYVFPGPGSYYVQLSADGYQTAWVRVVVRQGADDEIVEVDTELEKVKRRK